MLASSHYRTQMANTCTATDADVRLEKMKNTRHNIKFIKANEPIKECVTKFGGQPVWLDKPEWPLSKKAKAPMRFICQISLDDIENIDEGYKGKMAYLFMSDHSIEINGNIVSVYDQYDPEGCENAVILQPGGDRLVQTEEIDVGLSLTNDDPGYLQFIGEKPNTEYIEYAVDLHVASDPKYQHIDELITMPDSYHDSYCKSLSGNKLGGVPGFVQQDEFPFSTENSELVLQLDQGLVPFFVNFGDVGVGYIFIEKGGDKARFLWQCG